MKSLRFALLITLNLCFWSVSIVGQEFRISVDIPDLPDTSLILSHRYGLKIFADDTVRTDGRGHASFESKDNKPLGMYQIVLPGKKYAEFFVDKKQAFSIRTKASAPTDSLSFSGSPENSRFLKWQQDYTKLRNRSVQIQDRVKKGNLSPDSVQLFTKELVEIRQKTNQVWDDAIWELSGTLAGKFISGLKPVNIPEPLAKSNTKDAQLKQYQYLRAHFLDQVDFSNASLLRTPLIETKIDQYFKQIVPPVPDTIIEEVRQIIGRAKVEKDMYQFVIQYLFNMYSDPEIMGTDAVYVHIAENYYLSGETPWVDSANLRGIRYRVIELKPLLLGKVPPVLDGLVTADEQPFDIQSIKSKYLVVFFWSPDCGFCKEAAPKLNADYDELKQIGADIIAVNTRIDKEMWTKFITDNKLSWTNVYSPGKAREIIQNYQAFTTPVLYILDADRRIIAKSISVDQVKPFLKQYQSSH